MSDDVIRTLKEQLERKDKELARAMEQAIVRKRQNRELTAQVEALTGERDGAVKERDKLKKTGPDGSADELEKLRGEVRLYKHRDGISQLAYSPEIGVNRAVPIDHLMHAMGYRPEGDEFDAKSARKALEALKESAPFYFGQSAGGAGQTQAPGPLGAALSPAVAGLGSAMGRGSTPSPAGGPGDLTEDQMRDPVYMSQYNGRMRAGK